MPLKMVADKASGIIADMFNAAERGSAMGVSPNLSTTPVRSSSQFLALRGSALPRASDRTNREPPRPCLNEIDIQAGGFLSEASSWKWVGALLAFFALILTIAGSLFLPET
jgi:hypothetical protein